MDLNRLLYDCLNQHISERSEAVKKEKKRFVYYTSAETGLKILKNKEFWLRQPACMNDYMEVEYGFQCLDRAYTHGNHGFKEALDNVHPILKSEFESTFKKLLDTYRNDLYILCVSEHDGGDEDFYGRLSMWRAYSRGTGVAFVLNQQAFFTEIDALKSYSFPVRYWTDAEFVQELKTIATNINKHKDELRQLAEQNNQMLISLILHTFVFAVACTKHKGFKEEKEWRVIHSPKFAKSEFLKSSIEVIDGIPQEIFKIPVKDIPEQGLDFLNFEKLIDRIIIGPTEFPAPMHKSFVSALEEAKVSNPQKKVLVSDIPLRC